ncbi:MAG: hypothetical protein AAF661_17855 [Pseudomonadota bacterium]
MRRPSPRFGSFLGSIVAPLKPDELRQRILISTDLRDFDNTVDADSVWRGERSGFVGLRSLLEAFPNVRLDQIDSDVADVAWRALPFRHIVLATPERGPQSGAVEANLRAYFQEQIGAWSDGPARICYIEDPLLPRGVTLRIQFGHGVFVPDRDAEPVGRFEVAEDLGRDGGPGEWGALRFGGRNGRRAALYRDQSGITFASSLPLAPNIAAGGVLPDDHLFFFGRLSPYDPPVFEAMRRSGPEDGAVLQNSMAYRLEEDLRTDMPERAVVDANGRPAFYMRWRGDNAPTALRARRPTTQRPCLAVEGLAAPSVGWLRDVRRWWIDATTIGRLATEPLDERALTLASDSSGAVRVFDRKERTDRGVYVAPKPVPLGAGQEFRRPPFQIENKEAQHVWRTPLQSLRELGFMEIGQAETQRFNPFRSLSPEEISLDWVNACASVETDLRDDRGALRPLGLAEWSLRDAEVFCRVRGDGLELACEQPNRVAHVGEDGVVTPITGRQKLSIGPGEQFLVGCVHFRFLPAEMA